MDEDRSLRSGVKPELEIEPITKRDSAEARTGDPAAEGAGTKLCAYCAKRKPLAEFQRRTGRRRGGASRRGACKACRAQRRLRTPAAEAPVEPSASAIGPAEGAAVGEAAAAAPVKKRRSRRRRRSKAKAAVAPAAAPAGANAETAAANQGLAANQAGVANKAAAPRKASVAKKAPVAARTPSVARKAASSLAAGHPALSKALRRELQAIGLIPTRQGLIRMRGKTDNGRRWYQEVDPELALTLVKERAAVVVNRHAIRRLYSNKEFRRLILERDRYTCRFCGQYGDTIDHMLPRAKGGHTTPDNCVCACNECNQSKADMDMDEFIGLT